jgi:hypothetical protein
MATERLNAMAKKVRFKRLVRKDDDMEVLAITLHQKRHDQKGNRIPGHSWEEVKAMSPFERQALKARGWPIP